MHTVHRLFPTPVIEYKLGREFTKQELNFMLTRDMKNNITNSVTVQSDILNFKEMENIKSFIIESIEDYVKTAICPKNNLTSYITESWLNITEKGQSHHPHTHPNGFISGVLYISADTEKDKIFFHRNNNLYILNVETDNFNDLNSYKWWMKASPGILYLFPSTLSHEVEITTSDVVRVSLSFNTFIKGVIDTHMSSALTLE